MTVLPIGNLAQSLVAQQAQSRIQTDLTRLTLEMTNGVTSDIVAATHGDTRNLTALNRQISDLESFAIARNEAALLSRVSGEALASIRDRIAEAGERIAVVAQSVDPAQHAILTETAATQFAATVADLNTTVAGRSLFSGTAQDRTPLRDPQDILSDIAAAATAAGATTAADLRAAVDAYFAPGGAFDTNDYLGGTDDLEPISIGTSDRVDISIRADDPAVKNVLKTLAGLALAGLPGLDTDQTQHAIARTLDDVLSADRGMVTAQARIGAAEERIETAAGRAAGERAAFETARLDIIAIDPYRTAAKLQETQAQLQTLYTLTARLSGLNLVNFL